MDTGNQGRPGPPEERRAGGGAEELLTLQEAADRLKVHYMTAYRWVRRGELPAFKTGGRLRVSSADLDAFVTRRAVDTALPRSGQRTDWPLHYERLYRHLRAGDDVDAHNLVRKVVADGAPAGDVYVRLLAPALRRIGDDWSSDRICIAEEHRATEIVSAILKRQGEAFRRRGPRRGTAATLTPPDERHVLGAAMATDFLRAGGYDVSCLGGDVPVDDLARFLEGAPADVVCVSVTNLGLPPTTYAGIVEAARRANGEAVVVFGGQGHDPESVEAAGALALDDLFALNDAVGR